jgi:predicted RNase H-like HicB family nuclease
MTRMIRECCVRICGSLGEKFPGPPCNGLVIAWPEKQLVPSSCAYCKPIPADLPMNSPMLRLKLIVERHQDGYVAYPLGIEGIVVGQGDTYEEAVTDLRSAIAFHIETFGPGVLEQADPVQEVFLAEAVVPA